MQIDDTKQVAACRLRQAAIFVWLQAASLPRLHQLDLYPTGVQAARRKSMAVEMRHAAPAFAARHGVCLAPAVLLSAEYRCATALEHLRDADPVDRPAQIAKARAVHEQDGIARAAAAVRAAASSRCAVSRSVAGCCAQRNVVQSNRFSIIWHTEERI